MRLWHRQIMTELIESNENVIIKQPKQQDPRNRNSYRSVIHVGTTDEPGDDTQTDDENWLPSTRRYRLMKSGILVIVWISMGMYGTVTANTLPDFEQRLQTDYDHLGRALSAMSIGKIIGSPVCGYLRDRFPKHNDVLLGSLLILAGICSAARPWANSLPLLGFIMSVEGFAQGINSVGNAMMLALWGEEATTPTLIMHFGFGLGSLIVPQIARPFLSRNVTVTGTIPLTNESSSELPYNITNHTGLSYYITESRIEIPYGIIGGVTIFIGLLVFVFNFCNYTSAKQTLKVTPGVSTNKDTQKSAQEKRNRRLDDTAKWWSKWLPLSEFHNVDKWFIFTILPLMFLYYFVLVGKEITIIVFLFSYAVKSDLRFSKDEASMLDTAFWASYTGGRLVGAVVGKFVSIQVMLQFVLMVSLVVLGLITFVAYDQKTMLWVTSCIFGAIISLHWPSGVIWTNQYLPVTGMTVAMFDIANGVAGFFFGWLSGHMFQYSGPRSVLYISFISGAILCVVSIVMQIVASKHGTIATRQSKMP